MRMTNRMISFGVWIVLAALTAGRSLGYTQSSQPPGGSYQWSAELVSLDETNRTITVKAMAAGDALKQASNFKSGEKVMLNWSGFDKSANAVNGLMKYDATKKSETRFAFPAEFVAFDTAGSRVTFKAPIPAESIARIKTLKPGQWVTATSKHGVNDESHAISAVRGYNDLETTTSE